MNWMKSAAVVVAITGGIVATGSDAAFADSGTQGAALGSPGVISGNTVQIPTHVPINVCGNSIDIIGLLNPAFGNTCVND